MRIKIGPYVNWVGPYQIADKIFFWCEKYSEDELKNRWDYRAKDWLGEFLAYGFDKQTEEQKRLIFSKERPHSWLHKLLYWIHSKQKRNVKIKIDHWDTWNMDSTLALIILPMLKQLKETKHGSPRTDLEDVPENLRYTETEEYDSQQCFDFYHKEKGQKIECDDHVRWNWVLDEMIWTFEQFQPDYDWEEQYFISEHDTILELCKCDENSKPTLYEMENGLLNTRKVDWDSYFKHEKRIGNGLRLFGKYYRGLWD